jgi:hypothetical protein
MLYANAGDVILDDIFLDLTGFVPGVEWIQARMKLSGAMAALEWAAGTA